ncbi:DUF4336 domain-containing protein [Streptococcus suis]|uniref:DUF4336 domain-containing protein n=1 Tax=Streptococcus suis TaxID=1307 RepID=UPI000407FC47|nr:DUF4336 domain-containing protein [Streptococcus suis]MCO8220755.1 DUF4336 domain-containing protein [Streptococcus suis]HEM3512612.1 DUF4336 domain-containing protein [Streptococcus suis]HEM3527516.1 DUF4336 domain-containing protein [Streptococcus suis]HEM6561789.1 DUF4336 domain-containing protein [Streptococcus suis]
MTIAIKLYEPLYQLKPIAENIWIVDGPAIEMPFGLAKVPFSTRMTIIRLANGKLWCHSPIQPTQALLDSLDQLGEVAYLIGPNKLHYAYLQALYPQAQVWLAPGIDQRARAQKIPLPQGQELTDQAPPAWSAELEQDLFKGSRFMQEAVFFHKASKTLILTDMIENIETHQMKPHQRLLYKLGDNAYPHGKTPRDLRLTFVGKKKAARTSFETLKNWEPEKIILAHGQCFLKNGQEELDRAFKWVGEEK